MKNNLLKKFFSFSIGGYINVVIGLLTVPITTRLLSPEQYGVASLVNTVVNFLCILCYLGTDQGFVRFFYEEEEENRGRLLFLALEIPCVCVVIFSSIIFFFQDKISFFIVGENEGIIWKILILSMFFSVFNRFSLLIIRMKQRGKLYSFFNVLSKCIEFLFILILYKFYGDNYKTIVISILLSLIITTILSVILEKDMWYFKGKLKISKREFLSYSIPLSLTLALNWLFDSCDKVIIKFFSNSYELGLYSGSFKIIALISIIQSGFTTFWTPIAYEHYSKYPNDTLFFKKITDYLAIIFFSLGIGMLSIRSVIILLLGKEYYGSIFIMPMLVFVPIMYLLSETTMIGIPFKKQTKYFLYISLVVSLFNLIGNLLLVPSLGAKGAALSTAIAYILFFTLRTYISNKLIYFGFDLKKIYFIISLMFLYALILSFYKGIWFTILAGVVLEVIVLMIYFPTVKEIYYRFTKSVQNNNN